MIFKYIYKTIGCFIFVITLIYFSTAQAVNYKKFNSADDISDYFSGVLLFNDNKYNESYKYLKKLNGLEKSHSAFGGDVSEYPLPPVARRFLAKFKNRPLQVKMVELFRSHHDCKSRY